MAERSGRGGGRRVGVVVLVALTIAACGGRGQDYTVRGKVEHIPQANRPASELMISHEAIDDFVDRDGQKSGMDAMTMSYPLARGVSTAGLAVGEPVEMKLHVDWSADPPATITRIRKLPHNTQIVFRAAQPRK